jgi:hypothetical protein
VYTDLSLDEPVTDPTYAYYAPASPHRTLQVFRFGDTLTQEFNQTLIDTSVSEDYLLSGAIEPGTPAGTLVRESSRFGSLLWASDHYFVITEQLDQTSLDHWETYGYSVCTAGHTVPRTYRHCQTIYETRPNPAYVPPDNTGGDRACNGVTLADCLRAVARVANPTIDVPVGTECTEREYQDWVCDAHEYRTETHPRLTTAHATRLFIYEYTDSGFVRLATQVSEITNAGLDEQTLDDVVPTLTTSPESFDLAVPGVVQTLYFQNGFLYVVADGILQVYAMGDSSLVRTAALAVVEDRLQTSLFTDDRLYLSDFGYSGGQDQSVLRVVDLTNPAFPRQASQDRTLPGGHSIILPTSQGILTIGAVANYAPDIRAVIKLGLFTDPFASELAYLILGTDLAATYLGDSKAHYFDGAAERLFVSYRGEERDTALPVARVGVSHLEPGSIVTEGAVALPELATRVRPRPGAADELLSFATSSVEWLRPAGDEWSATPLLEYFTPIALYRQTDADDYVEVLRLGARCRLSFATADTINDHPASEDEFDCPQWGVPWAYGQNLVFSDTTGVHFDAATQAVTLLTEEEIAALVALRAERPICLFSTEIVDDISVDVDEPPPLDDLTCYTPEEYLAARADAWAAAAEETSG